MTQGFDGIRSRLAISANNRDTSLFEIPVVNRDHLAVSRDAAAAPGTPTVLPWLKPVVSNTPRRAGEQGLSPTAETRHGRRLHCRRRESAAAAHQVF